MANPHTATALGHSAYEEVSALQKCIRRGLTLEAYYWAKDLWQSGHGLWLNSRLKIIIEEDVGIADPLRYLAAHAALSSYLAGYPDKKHCDLALFNCIYALCKANPKTRDADAGYWAVKHEMLTQPPKPIPDFAVDHHTARGKQMGRTEATVGHISYFLDHDATNPEWKALLRQAEAWASQGHDIDASPNPAAVRRRLAEQAGPNQQLPR